MTIVLQEGLSQISQRISGLCDAIGTSILKKNLILFLHTKMKVFGLAPNSYCPQLTTKALLTEDLEINLLKL